MKRVTVTLIAGVLFVFIAVGASGRSDKRKQRTPKKPTIAETEAGVIPNEWGDLVNVTSGSGTQLVLTFKDDDGDLRIIKFTSRLPDNCILIKRAY